ncbi:hypothetical protein DFH06DRAFT_531885 [Mycena polygramma]|nr:hypothetical protein DFH06DRAFT_531885 [Mycena polygramma]
MSMLLLVRHATHTRLCVREAVVTTLFHSSAPVSWKKKKASFGLIDDLTPTSPLGSIDTAPPQPSKKARGKRLAFERDPLPHTKAGILDVQEPLGIHTAPPQPSKKARGKRPAFERDLLPHTNAEIVDVQEPLGSIHTAPPQSSKKAHGKLPAFERDPLPHTSAEIVDKQEPPPERNPSFRRRSRARSEHDWARRTGKWSASKFDEGPDRGSQMWARQDRPQSYGFSSGTRHGADEGFQDTSRAVRASTSSFPRRPEPSFTPNSPGDSREEMNNFSRPWATDGGYQDTSRTLRAGASRPPEPFSTPGNLFGDSRPSWTTSRKASDGLRSWDDKHRRRDETERFRPV